MGEEVDLKKVGVRFDPPALVVTYINRKSQKMRRRTMPLRNFNKNTGVDRIIADLRSTKRHEKFLNSLPPSQLQRLVTIIRDRLNGMSLEASIARNKAMDSLDPEEDLCKVDDETLKRKKLMMEQTFEKNRKKPGDPDFQYDLEVNFEAEGAIETSGWDEDDDSDPEF